MSRKKDNGVLFVGPGPQFQGGIAAVLDTYGLSRFWEEFSCSRFSSTSDTSNRLAKILLLPFRYFAFLATLATHRPGVISMHTSSGRSFYRKFVYLVLARVFRVPVVFHIHPQSFFEFYRTGGQIQRCLIRLSGRLSDQIVFLSEGLRNNFSTVYTDRKLEVLPNPVPVARYDQWSSTWRQQPHQILYLGWIIRAKGVYDLVEVVPKIVAEYPRARFIFAGNKEVEHLKALITKRNLDRNAHVLGWVDGRAKTELLRTSRVLVLPSYSEGVPNVLLEAMASHLPIVTTAVGGITSILAHDRDCLFVKPGDVEGLAAALCRILKDETLRERLASAAFREVQDTYDTERIGSRLKSIYARYRLSSHASLP